MKWLLDLRFEKGPCPLPPGFLLGMKKLEELYLGEYFDTSYEEKEHMIKDISSLKALNTLQIITDDTQFLMQLLQACSEKLERFQIAIIKKFHTFQHSQFQRYLCLMDIDPNMLTEPGIKSLIRRSDVLFLSVEGWKIPVIELDEDGFTNLKSLHLRLLNSEYLIEVAGSIPSVIFCKLKQLGLRNMPDLKEIFNGNHLRVEHLTRRASELALFCSFYDSKYIFLHCFDS